MNHLKKSIFTLLTTGLLLLSSLHATELNLQDCTPIGSWQIRQEISTDDNGKQTMTIVKTSMVGKETRKGVNYVWVEMAVDNFKMRNGKKGKQNGEHTVIKILLEEDFLDAELEDVFNNLRGLGSEIIMQSGDQDPMLIEEGGMMGGALMQAMGTEIDYKFTEKGSDTVSVPAGDFKCKVIEGKGSVETKIVFKTIRVESEARQWISESVPFGIVKMESTSVMNDKPTQTSAVLLEYGTSGATSEIKGTPQKMEIPGLGDLFG